MSVHDLSVAEIRRRAEERARQAAERARKEAIAAQTFRDARERLTSPEERSERDAIAAEEWCKHHKAGADYARIHEAKRAGARSAKTPPARGSSAPVRVDKADGGPVRSQAQAVAILGRWARTSPHRTTIVKAIGVLDAPRGVGAASLTKGQAPGYSDEAVTRAIAKAVELALDEAGSAARAEIDSIRAELSKLEAPSPSRAVLMRLRKLDTPVADRRDELAQLERRALTASDPNLVDGYRQLARDLRADGGRS